MSNPLSARLDALVRQLRQSNWITRQQLAELEDIANVLRTLRAMSDRVRQAIYLLLESVEITEKGRVIIRPGCGQDFYWSISELNRIIEDIRPKRADEQRKRG